MSWSLLWNLFYNNEGLTVDHSTYYMTAYWNIILILKLFLLLHMILYRNNRPWNAETDQSELFIHYIM